ncbi:DUF2007 domain-containing protein [Lysobacter pythonis]|uniref:DUF2007 domain-containing protein n=1 Tax=Solilutibacter pythonis TaxID=2483112 RepID=A0A3M2HGQ8_9GAMM|nr:DUF2007 domain-containing protein [Lysobacter pythonis]RMH87615.1 DUF2007 domain-containing protein [Lysobacter pythonis]
MRTVYHAIHPINAHLVKHALEDAGIPAFVFGEHLIGGMGELLAGAFIEVRVPDECLEAARALVAALPMETGIEPADDRDGDDDDAPGEGWLRA